MKSYLTLFAMICVTTLNTQAQTLPDESELCNKVFQDNISFVKQIVPRNTNEITFVTWNAHKLADPKFIQDLKIISTTADIIFIQEALHSTQLQNQFSERLPFAFSFHKSFCTSEKKATGVMSAARFKLQNNMTLFSPDTEPISFTPKVSAYSQIVINQQIIHLINTHALNFNSGIAFENQIDHLTRFISQLKGPVIWAGDFNTWNAGRKSYLNVATESLGLKHLIPTSDHRNLILDQIYVRGLSALKVEVLPNTTSDHFPMRAILKLN